MNYFIQLLKEGWWGAWVCVIGIVFLTIMVSYLAYIISTGQDAYSVDNKAFQSAKNNCSKLKDYLLLHPDDYHTDAGRTIYLVNCK